MINRTEVVDYTRSDHFKKRARQRFGISMSIMRTWITNIVNRGSFSSSNQENVMFLDCEEIRIVIDTKIRVWLPYIVYMIVFGLRNVPVAK